MHIANFCWLLSISHLIAINDKIYCIHKQWFYCVGDVCNLLLNDSGLMKSVESIVIRAW